MTNEKAPNYRSTHVFDPIHNGADECECGLMSDADIHESDDAYEERMRPRIVNSPERIWLQSGCDDEAGEIEWKDLSHSDVSWCDERIYNTDIEYARVSASAAPVVDSLVAENLKSIIVRCEDGDKRADWLPIIAKMARAALNKLESPAAATAAPAEQSGSLLMKIATIADIGSAEEFGDALDRLRGIRDLISGIDRSVDDYGVIKSRYWWNTCLKHEGAIIGYRNEECPLCLAYEVEQAEVEGAR